MWGSVQKERACRRGFVTLDVIWIMILLGLAIVLSIHGIGLVEKRENAGRLERELLVVTKAVEQLAEEKGLEPGVEVSFAEYSPFLEKGVAKRLRDGGVDPVGGHYGTQAVGRPAQPDPSSVKALGKFWEQSQPLPPDN